MITINKVNNFLLAIIFLQMLFFPKIYMNEKMIFVFLAIVICIIKKRLTLKMGVGKILILFYLCWNIFSIVVGICRGYGQEALRLGTVDILWPMVYLLLSSEGLTERQIKWLYKALVKTTFFFIILDIILIIASLANIDNIKKFLMIFNLKTPYVTKGSGFLAFRVDHLYFYAFLTPFMLALLLKQNKNIFEKLGLKSWFVRATALLSVVMSLLTGMGGVWLACFLALFICLYQSHIIKKRKAIFSILLLGVIILAVFVKSYAAKGSVFYMVDEILQKFGVSSTSQNESVRISQIKAMLAAWAEHPIVGNGRGYPVGYMRLNEYYFSSSHEMSYFVMLYQKGIVGLLSFFSIVFYSAGALLRETKISWFSKPFFVGFMCFLISNNFNPYLTNFSCMWILFLPIVMEQHNQVAGRSQFEKKD